MDNWRKNWGLMSHHQYSYQASGVFLLLISEHQWGVSVAMCYFQTNWPYREPHLTNKLESSQLRYQKSSWRLFRLISEMFRADPAPCSSPFKGVPFSVTVLLPDLPWRRGRRPSWQLHHHQQGTLVLPGLGDVYASIYRGTCGVALEIFLMGSFPCKYTESWCSGRCWVCPCNVMKVWNVLKVCGNVFSEHTFCWIENGIAGVLIH